MIQLTEARKQRDAAQAEEEKIWKLMEEKDRSRAVADKAAQELSVDYQNRICSLSDALEKEKLNTTDALNQRDAASAELEKEKARKVKIAQAEIDETVQHAIKTFKESEEGRDWVNSEMAEPVYEAILDVMNFMNSKHSGIDWAENDNCRMVLEGEATNQGQEEGDPEDEGWWLWMKWVRR